MAFSDLHTFISAAERGEDVDKATDNEAGESDIDPELADFGEKKIGFWARSTQIFRIIQTREREEMTVVEDLI